MTLTTLERCQLTSHASPEFCFDIFNVASWAEIREKSMEGNWKYPSYNTRQNIDFEMGLPPLLCGLEEGNKELMANSLSQVSDLLCWSTSQKLWWDSYNSLPNQWNRTLFDYSQSSFCQFPKWNIDTVLPEKVVFVEEKNASETSNRNF